MLKTLLKEVKEYKRACCRDSGIYDTGSPDGDADPVPDGIDH